jgi:hypothetical protein
LEKSSGGLELREAWVKGCCSWKLSITMLLFNDKMPGRSSLILTGTVTVFEVEKGYYW